jgi:hypothetical protein
LELVPVKNKNILLIYLGLTLAEVLCWGAFAFEIHRALEGNELSWAYVFEWPIFALYAVYMWRRMLHDERRSSDPTNSTIDDARPGDDAALEEYNAYLREVHRKGGPKGT